MRAILRRAGRSWCAVALATTALCARPSSSVSARPAVSARAAVTAATGDPPQALGRGSVAACSRFHQRDGDDDSVELTIDNGCTAPLACSVRWRLTCAPAVKARRRVVPGRVELRIEPGQSETRTVTTRTCGDDGWTVDAVVWRCAVAPT
jgi:hypothetical protein